MITTVPPSRRLCFWRDNYCGRLGSMFLPTLLHGMRQGSTINFFCSSFSSFDTNHNKKNLKKKSSTSTVKTSRANTVNTSIDIQRKVKIHVRIAKTIFQFSFHINNLHIYIFISKFVSKQWQTLNNNLHMDIFIPKFVSKQLQTLNNTPAHGHIHTPICIPAVTSIKHCTAYSPKRLAVKPSFPTHSYTICSTWTPSSDLVL